MNDFNCVRIPRQNLPFSVRVLASVESTASSECTVTQFFQRDRQAADIFDEVGHGPSKDSFWDSQRTVRNKPRSVPSSRVLVQEGAVRCLAHLGELVAAKPHILEMIQDAVTAGLLPKQSLVARLDAVKRGSEKTTARLYLQIAALAADEAWQQTVGLRFCESSGFRGRALVPLRRPETRMHCPPAVLQSSPCRAGGLGMIQLCCQVFLFCMLVM